MLIDKLFSDFNNNIIYDLSNTENHIFITTEVGLYIYDNNNNKIYDLQNSQRTYFYQL